MGGSHVQELIALAIIALVGMCFVIKYAVLPSLRKAAWRRRDELADLRNQIAGLRDEVELLKKGTDKKDSPDGITTEAPN